MAYREINQTAKGLITNSLLTACVQKTMVYIVMHAMWGYEGNEKLKLYDFGDAAYHYGFMCFPRIHLIFTQMIKEQLGDVPSHAVQLFSFSQDRDSVLNTPEGREKLTDAGIAPPQAVGDWLAGVFESQLEQDEVAQQLRDYVHVHSK